MRLCYGLCVVIGALALVKATWGQNAKCLASGGTERSCVPVEQCSTIKALLDSPFLTQQDVNIVRAAQFACVGENTRNVCCASHDIIESTTGKRVVRAAKKISPDCLQDRLGEGHGHNGSYPSESFFIVYIRHGVLNANKSVQYGQCGGSLISSQYVLTAAHCVKDKGLFDVYIGATNLNYTHPDGTYPDGLYQELGRDDAIVHEGYNEKMNVHDIALLRLREPVDFSLPNSPKPVCIPSAEHYESYLSEYPVLVTYGWGENIKGVQSVIKQTAYLQYLPLQYCKPMMKAVISLHGFVLDEGNLCTRTISGHSSFKGYSGSPLMYRQNQVWFMVALASFGISHYGEASNNYPAVATSIAHHGDWIIGKIKHSQRGL
ncbi:phenoloxidase-activating factor 1-like [Anopheles aquasalis]|uniref:phenoloxidase-activating factor 1-like n=1 Tax=Anopheles aquasalis TaxID=42839 RepID=UPI00215B49E2|nr:phenoloxidase-activating factor 1-like [Anopheles aquasalis]